MTGVFDGDKRFIGNIRSQWNAAPVSYLSFSGSYDMIFSDKKERHTPWGAGILFDYDRAGDSKLNLTGLALTGSYTLPLGKRLGISFGLMGGVAQRAYKTSGLFHMDTYIPGKEETNPTAENLDKTGKFYLDLSGGMNLHYKVPGKRTTVDLGGGMYHINRPQNNFFDQKKSCLKQRYTVQGVATLMLAPKFDLMVNALSQFQGPHSEVVFGGGGIFHLNQKRTKELSLMAGMFYRTFDNKDALIPMVGVNYQGWHVGFSYDLNTSEFTEASARRGGPELSVVYIIKNVAPEKYCPNCPVYL